MLPTKDGCAHRATGEVEQTFVAGGNGGAHKGLFAPEYFGELRRNVRPLAAASLGSGVSLMLMSYTSTLFGPYLIRAFHWERSQFALIGLSMLATLIALPFIGLMSDRLGVRRTAIVGVLGIPLCLFSYSLMTGSFAVFFAISCSMLVLGSFTSPVVYTRLIAHDFKQARGLALTFVTIAPAAIAVVLVPLLTMIIDSWGWRIGYRALALFVLVGGLCAIAIIPREESAQPLARAAKRVRAKGDFALILRSRPFWIIFAAMFLCTLQTPLHAAQMGLMLADNRLDSTGVALMISTYGVGTIIGRFICGLALDRFPAPQVAAASMILPALGYALLATQLDHIVIIGLSMFLVGIAFGAEGDLQSYLVARHFSIRIFSSALSLVFVGVFAASASGSILLSVTLKQAHSFAPFLAGMAVVIAIGSAAFLALPRHVGPKLIGEDDTAKS